jgi:glycosyltransferase involved in cell wall biosynthesis
MIELSIVLGTYNRMHRIVELVQSVRERVKRSYEIVVADGGSTDGTREWLVMQSDVTFLGERYLHGAIDAYNKAFSLSCGKHVAHLNDDCLLVDDALDAACDMLDTDPQVGQVALPFVDGMGAPQVNYVHMSGVLIPYANFGVLPRALGDSLGWWGDFARTYGGDCHLSFSVWNAGFRVVPLSGKYLHHYREQDGLRRENTESRRFFEHWAGKTSADWIKSGNNRTTTR